MSPVFAGISHFPSAPIPRHTTVKPPDLGAQTFNTQSGPFHQRIKRRELRRAGGLRRSGTQTTLHCNTRWTACPLFVTPFRVCGVSYRSASAAVTQMRQQLDGCRGNRAARVRAEYRSQRWIAAALRRRSGFPWLTGPRVLFQRGWEHDGFYQVVVYWSVRRRGRWWSQPLTAATTRSWCCTLSKMLTGAQEARAKNRIENRVRMCEDCRTKKSVEARRQML